MSHAFSRSSAALLLSVSFSAMMGLSVSPAHAEPTIEELKAELAKARNEVAYAKQENQALRAKLNAHKSQPALKFTKKSLSHGSSPQTPSRAAQTLDGTKEDVGNLTSKKIADGIYFGINGGYGGGDISDGSHLIYQTAFSNDTNSVRAGGALAGGQIGYRYRLTRNFMTAIEADFDWANIGNQSGQSMIGVGPNGFSATGNGNTFTGINWIGTVRPKIGYEIGSFTLYATGGLAYGIAVSQTINSNTFVILSGSPIGNINSAYANNSKITAGWAAGAGVEYAIDEHWSFKTDYLYTQIGSASPNVVSYNVIWPGTPSVSAIPSFGQTAQLGFHQIRAGFNYHPQIFSDISAPLVTKF